MSPPQRGGPTLSAGAQALLAAGRDSLQAPIRAELFSADRFAQHGQSLGQAQQVHLRPRRRAAFFPRLQDNIAVLREAYRYVDSQALAGQAVSPAGEWLLDNFHLIAEQFKTIHEGLPRRYFLNLPVLSDEHLAGLPRVVGMAWALVAHTDSRFSEPLLLSFLAGYQRASDLTLGEMWALPTTLRVVLIENLRRLCERMAMTEAAREMANAWCDRPDALGGFLAADNPAQFARMQARGVGRAFALQVMQRLHADSGPTTAAAAHGREGIRAALARALPDPVAAQAEQTAQEAADNLSVSQAITALREIGHADWRTLIARSSALMQLVQQAPSFGLEHETTQDASLHAIERLARRSSRSELTVADTVLRLMRHTPQGDKLPAQTLGYWLLGAGSAELNEAVGLRANAGPTRSPLGQRLVLASYLGVMALGTLGLAIWFLQRHGGGHWHGAVVGVAAVLLALWPASEAVIAVVNRLVSESIPPRLLPRLALADGIPAAHRVLVVVPTMLTSSQGITDLAAQLERHYLANVEPHAQFALLADYADAPTAQAPRDADLLDQALLAIDLLESGHPRPPAEPGQPTPPRRFLLLLRERRWSESEQAWIGWERKRGKLEELVAWLAAPGAHKPFIDLGAASSTAADTPYVVTLDSDTLLPPASLRALVGVAAHPLNQPQIVARRVVSGYGILQPRITAPLATPGAGSLFHWLFAGPGGLDPYSAASSEVHQDLFGMGTFTGKGLLQVAALHALLGQRLPQDQVLSHDLVEGAITRCGGVSDISLIEEAPMHADVAASRLHRWTRGDWQLLPLLARAGHYGIGAVDRWKIIDNLRRSLVAPLSAALLVVSLAAGALPAWAASAISPWAAMGLVTLALGGGSLLGALAGLVPHHEHLAWRHFLHGALANAGRALGGTLWRIALLLQTALGMADAVVRALWRMAVSRRLLLQWTTAAAAQAAASQRLSALLRRHAPVSALALALWLILLMLNTPAPGLATGLCLLWAGTPLWIWWASRQQTRVAVPRLAPIEHAYLLGVARDTWRLFEDHVGEASHHLPPDNVQTTPGVMVAQRTSPTNIGLYLLSAACAHRFGWITLEAWLGRSERTLDTLDTLPRYRGHFYNWIHTGTLATLPPDYVSTVDSGNLCGHLIAVAGACQELITHDAAINSLTRERLTVLAQRCRRMADEPEFGFLLNPRRRLFHIGLRVAELQPDDGFYDLLASESRLASLWAIAKGDVPVSHWGALGRPFFAVGAMAGLRSWSGSMFEYLMPSLVLDEPPGSVLDSAVRSAVREQIAWGRARGVPWGFSECAHAAVDHTLAYQYAPQGVPRLAMRRTPPDDLVVAPYATLLAAMFDPQAAIANLQVMEGLHARSNSGFVEALDYSPDHQSAGKPCTVVATFMAHHQGMGIVALANVLLAGAPRRWAMADPRLNAMATLLQERVPSALSRLPEPAPQPSRVQHGTSTDEAQQGMVPASLALAPTQLMGNGRLSVALRPNGAGWTRFEGKDITRWRDDALRDAHGSFLYLRRPGQAHPVSITQHPAPDREAHYSASFLIDRVCLEAKWPELRTRCTVWVNPGDDVELRRIELWNTSSTAQQITLMSMFEVALSDARADESHPAFANLFVSADWQAQDQALYLSRQPRLATEAGLMAAHFVAQASEHLGDVQVQASRAAWLGRGRDAANPLADHLPAGTASGPLDTGLDPVAALALTLMVPAHGRAEVTLGTAAAHTHEALVALVQRHRQPLTVAQADAMSSTYAGIFLHEGRISPDTLQALRTLATPLALWPTRPPTEPVLLHHPAHPNLLPQASTLVAGDRRLLWRFGLSGDRPLMVVALSAPHGLPLVKSLARGLRWWARGGLPCDLVVLNGEPRSYLTPMQSELKLLAERHLGDSSSPPGNPVALNSAIVLLHLEDLSPAELSTLTLHARVRLYADGRPLAAQAQELAQWHQACHNERQEASDTVSLPRPWARTGPSASPGPALGGFEGDGGAYQLQVDSGHQTPRPWVNVLANPGFGGLVSEAGSGFTWAGNSRLHQITPWSNDPVGDPSAELFLVQDQRRGLACNVAPGEGSANVPYQISHRTGQTTITHQRDALHISTTWCVDPQQAIKQVRIVLHNAGSGAMRLRVIGQLEWQLGAQRSDRRSVRTALARLPGPSKPSQAPVLVDALLATQQDGHAGFGGATAFFTLHRNGAPDALIDDWTCDRQELFGPDGQRVVAARYGRREGSGLDPCAVAATSFRLPAGHSTQCLFTIGHAGSPQAARALASQAALYDGALREATTRSHWQHLLGGLQVQTPDPLFDVLVNHWLLYQTLACRLWARAGFYQAGGAFGYRDQLQDAMALAVPLPGLLRRQLLLAASRQFVQGDVQHWWHPPLGAGVRTHMSDDLLWLPCALLRHVQTTSDDALLDETVPFLTGQAVPPDAEDAYFAPEPGHVHGTLYEHGARAIDHSLSVGVHGLPLMGTGDWNDGMNRVGHGGKGESVWLGFFLCFVVGGYAPLARARGDVDRAERWESAAVGWRTALQGVAWDGAWFVRAFFDDGSPLGSARNTECRIDLIAQAWSVLSGAATSAQQRTAMASVAHLLTDKNTGLTRLLTPPLEHAQPEAGYIQAYPPGVRENGGQYNHAAIWALMAQAHLGDAEGAWATFKRISPAHRSANAAQAPAYGLEPYAVAADIYSQPPWAGRGGWSWYTGSAAWLHRAAIESICGLQVRGSSVRLTPCLPRHWPVLTLTLVRDGLTHRFVICAASAKAEIARALADGAVVLKVGAWLQLPLVSGVSHLVVCGEVVMAAAAVAVPLSAA